MHIIELNRICNVKPIAGTLYQQSVDHKKSVYMQKLGRLQTSVRRHSYIKRKNYWEVVGPFQLSFQVSTFNVGEVVRQE